MRNIDVIKAFLNNRKAKTQNLNTDGTVLVNYRTAIGYWYNGKLFVNRQRYSVTTSKLQNWLLREAGGNHVVAVASVEGCDGLIKYAHEYKMEGAGA
jgi:hypothetical protein